MPHHPVGWPRVIRAPNAGIDAGDRRAPAGMEKDQASICLGGSARPLIASTSRLRSSLHHSAMFFSPCSLRSTQCATLIALAAAAGISRTGPAPEKPTAPHPVVGAQTFAAIAAISRAQFYLAAMQTLAPSFRVSCATFDFERDDATGYSTLDLPTLASAETSPPVAPPEESPLIFRSPAAPALSARQHSYPYAVGPPRRGIAQSLRVADTAVPGDSSTRRSQVSRIARVFIAVPSALLTRLTDSGPKLAESIFSPNSAPHACREPAESGDPGFPPHHIRSLARSCAPAWRVTAFFSS